MQTKLFFKVMNLDFLKKFLSQVPLISFDFNKIIYFFELLFIICLLDDKK